MAKRIYADYAAATPVDPQVEQRMAEVSAEAWGNPSALYAEGVAARRQLEAARKAIAVILGCKPHELVLSSGSTEALNLAIQGVLQRHPKGEVVASRLEHAAVVRPIEASDRETVWLPVPHSGVVDPAAVKAAITDQTVLVALMYANNELGTIQPLAKIGALIKQVRVDRQKRGVKLPIYLLSDAAQAGWLSLGVDRLGVDLLSLGGAKLYGPRGSGLLYVRDGVELDPVLLGGGQQRGRRSGSESAVMAAGLALALQQMQAERHDQAARLSQLRDRFEAAIFEQLPDTLQNGGHKQRLPQFSNLSFPGIDGETLVAYLDQAGIAAATGSACNAANEEPSAVLQAIGLTRDQAVSSLRLSFGRQTTDSDIDRLIKLLPPLVTKLRQQ